MVNDQRNFLQLEYLPKQPTDDLLLHRPILLVFGSMVLIGPSRSKSISTFFSLTIIGNFNFVTLSRLVRMIIVYHRNDIRQFNSETVSLSVEKNKVFK